MKASRKNLLRTIRGSLGRFVAIMAIIALGASMFVGLLSTKSDMVATGQVFMDRQNMFDLRLVSTYGWTEAQVEQAGKLPGVVSAEGMITMDVIGSRGGEASAVYKLHAIPQQIDKVNLLGGRMPQAPDECLVDGFHVSDAVLGTEFTILPENSQDTMDSFKEHTYTVVGYVSTPLYMDMSRGTTSLGNGNVSSYLYLPKEAFATEYYTDISITLDVDRRVYTTAFHDAMADFAERLKPQVQVLADSRFAALQADALSQYEEGSLEYEDGCADYEKARAEVMAELSDALSQLQSAQSEIDTNRQSLEEGIAQLQEGQAELDRQKNLLQDSQKQLLDAKAESYEQLASAYGELMENYKTVHTSLTQVEDGLSQIQSGLAAMDEGLAQLQDGLAQIAEGENTLALVISLKQMQVEGLEAALSLSGSLEDPLTQALRQQLEQARAELVEYLGQQQMLAETKAQLEAQKMELEAQRPEILAQQKTLLETRKTLKEAMSALELGLMELESSQTQAENSFAAAQAKLDAGLLQLESAQEELDENVKRLADGQAELEKGQAELDAAWAEYEAGKATAEAELADAKRQLEEAEATLNQAKADIEAMAPAEVFLLDRCTNTGYMSLESSSDIVAGVSRVFPAFFLLVAALVCITTMTRMVEEERMQIGTMKSLGYSSTSIIGKYLWYAGIAAVAGCGLGVILGSIVFPLILWAAYGIMLNIQPNVVLQVNWPLCLSVVSVYTTVMLAVTWYCCHKTLREVPAQLLRPKMPTSGRKIFLEKLPGWKKLSFLNKVMLRNVLRYRQRMFMMLVGIGGCTALLLTGFGLRDSIVGIVDHQFEHITPYDLNVYFSKAQSLEAQEAFRQDYRKDIQDVLFYYQTGLELVGEEGGRDVYLIAADSDVTKFIYLMQDGQSLPLPGLGQTHISVGAAEALGIEVGDDVILRDENQRALRLEVAGIFDNNVYNYALVSPETLQAQWPQTYAPQMAFVNLRDTSDVYAVSASMQGREGVMNLVISQDMRSQISKMLEALDLVVITVVVCAAALAMIVLYNLTNINITERLREIATLKVLGFYSKETAAYVFKENLLLSSLGTLVGLLGGRFLLEFVMSQIKIDMVWFQATFTVGSCVLAVVLTLVAACLVDFLLYFKLDKINMAEALKSVE